MDEEINDLSLAPETEESTEEEVSPLEIFENSISINDLLMLQCPSCSSARSEFLSYASKEGYVLIMLRCSNCGIIRRHTFGIGQITAPNKKEVNYCG